MYNSKDFSCLDLAVYFNNCQAHYFWSDIYEKLYPQEKDRWWLDKNEMIVDRQKIHFITYLGACYKLQKNKKDSLKHVWSGNGFKNAAGLIWFLEAIGANKRDIKKAFAAGEKVARNKGKQPEQSKAIKQAIGWDLIIKLCDNKNICRPML